MDAGQKRKADSDNDRVNKRPFAIKGMGGGGGGAAKGISIKGAAAAAAAAVSTSPPPSSSRSPVRSSAGAPPSILSRINNHTRQQGQKRSAQDDINRQHPKRPASNETVPSLQKQSTTTPSSPIPISTTGKSSKLVVSNLSDTVAEKELRDLGQTIRGGIKDIDIDREAQKATVIFNNAEAAVIFRRKYNR